ncbi:MAG: hypothetical protein ABEJ55_05455 [Halanaeroarchaeum sp.]
MSDLARSASSYRLVDAATKLAGVALLVGALELGIASAPGVALALVGAALGVSTVFVTEESL